MTLPLASGCVGLFLHVVTKDASVACCNRDQRRHHANERRLPGAIRTEQTENLALFHGEVDIVYGSEITVLLDDVFDFNSASRRRSGRRLHAFLRHGGAGLRRGIGPDAR